MNINISNFAFSPTNLTVKAGTTVVWTNHDVTGHTVTSDNGTLMQSPTLGNGVTYSVRFNNIGSFGYHCSIHPFMTGLITVTQ